MNCCFVWFIIVRSSCWTLWTVDFFVIFFFLEAGMWSGCGWFVLPAEWVFFNAVHLLRSLFLFVLWSNFMNKNNVILALPFQGVCDVHNPFDWFLSVTWLVLYNLCLLVHFLICFLFLAGPVNILLVLLVCMCMADLWTFFYFWCHLGFVFKTFQLMW